MVQKRKAPVSAGAGCNVKSRRKNKRKPAKLARTRNGASEKFDEQLLILSDLPPLPQIDGSFLPTNAANYLVALHERLEGIDRNCRGIWQNYQGETVTPEFVRDVLERQVMAQISAVEGKFITLASAMDPTTLGTAWANLAEELGKLKSEFANRYAREIEGLVLVKAKVAEYGAQGGRPRNEGERKKIREKRDAGMPWKQVAKEMDAETGNVRTVSAYRYLLSTEPPQKKR